MFVIYLRPITAVELFPPDDQSSFVIVYYESLLELLEALLTAYFQKTGRRSGYQADLMTPAAKKLHKALVDQQHTLDEVSAVCYQVDLSEQRSIGGGGGGAALSNNRLRNLKKLCFTLAQTLDAEIVGSD